MYRVLGFLLRSEIAFPELREANLACEPGPNERVVEVLVGPVPDSLPSGVQLLDWFHFEEGRCLYLIGETGRMMVEGGSRITFQLGQTAPISDMRSYVLGTGLGTIVHQNGMVPLHVGAVLSPAGVLAFTGPSGAGKSTAVAAVNRQLGWPLVGDDLATLSLDGTTPTIDGGVRRLRLWRDAVERLGWSEDDMTRDLHRADKYITYDHGTFVDRPGPLIGVYEIDPDASPASPEELRGAAKMSMFLNAVYRPFLVGPCRNHAALYRVAAGALGRITCWRGARPDIEDVVKLLKMKAKTSD
ncbi:MAG: hypothetical protein AAF865_10175 [Pseudomonadota bacterium]